MRERVYYQCEGAEQKRILDALKNEQKYRKQIPLIGKDGEEICKIAKWDTYTTYIDFWLNNFISDIYTKNPGRIDNIEIYEYETSKGQKINRVKQITA